MFTVLIVDDHIHQVESLATTTPWSDYRISTIHKAYTGLQAMKMLEEHRIDMLITDIRMPEMNGLELIEAARKLNKDLPCILLTGYAEFEYAKKAIELQAVDYLIKPVEDEELLRSLSHATAALKSQQSKQEGMHQTIRLNVPILRKNLLADILSGQGMLKADLEQKLTMYELPFHVTNTVRLLLIDMDSKFEAYSPVDRSLIEYSMGNIAEETLSSQFDFWQAPMRHGVLAFLLKEKEEHGAGERADAQSLEEAVRSVQCNIAACLSVHPTAYLSRSISFPEAVADACRLGLAKLDKHEFVRKGDLLLEHELSGEEQKIGSVKSLHQQPTFLKLMETQNWEGFRTKLNSVFAELMKDSSAPSRLHITEVYMHLLSNFITLAHMNGYVLEEMIGSTARPVGEPFRTAEQLKSWGNSVFELIRERAGKEEGKGLAHSSIIQSIHQYIDQHLADNVTLQALADHVYLHPTYLSKMYKELTGQNISDYILQLKMETSKQMLKQPDLKIYQIAERVGYHSTQHFISEFKKYFGSTPKSYRKLLNE